MRFGFPSPAGRTARPTLLGAAARAQSRRALVSLALGSLALVGVAGCAPPTTIIDVANAPQLTRDAMLNVFVLPLGMDTPPGVGSVGPVSGFGCGATPVDASGAAVEQLRIKALEMRATGVVGVMIASSTTSTCQGGYGMLANGIAVAPRAMPPSW